MSTLVRAALLLLVVLGCARLNGAETDELALLRAKAEQGNALAQYNLGLVYVQGRLTPADPAEAFAWLTLASESGATGKALDSLLGNISDAQLTEGRRRLNTYRTALASKSSPLSTHATPKLAPRGFSLEAPPTIPPPAETPTTPLTKVPEPVAPATIPTPADGANASDPAQLRKELEQTRADLDAARAELATLRATISRLESAPGSKPSAPPASAQKP
jgi:TPR repeat protein